MGDVNPIRTLGDYSRPSHEAIGRNTIELPKGTMWCLFDPTISGPISTWEDLYYSCSLLRFFHREGLQNSVTTSLCSNNIKESLFLKYGLVLRTYSKKSLIMASTFGSKSKSFMTYSQSMPAQMTIESIGWCLKPISNNNKQDDPTKINTVLKAITDRMAGALPSDTVKKPKLNVNSTSPVSPGSINTIKLEEELKDIPQLEPKYPVATEEKESNGNTSPRKRSVEWIDVEEPLDLIDTRHKFMANAYIDVDLPMNIMSLAYYKSIRKDGYEYRGRNFMRLGRDMHVSTFCLDSSFLIMRTKPGVDSLSFDNMYNNLRVFENDVKGSTASSSSTQNVAFVSENTSSTNNASTAYGVSNPSGQKPHNMNRNFIIHLTCNYPVSYDSMRMKKFYKKTGRNIQFDAKEPVGFDKTKVECYSCHKTGHFARECGTKGNHDSKKRDAWNSANKDGRRSGKQEDSKALVTIDGEGVDWTSHSEEEEDYALMACNSSGLDTEVISCSKECKESYAELKKLYDKQRAQLSDASIEILSYTQALKKVEAQLVAHQQGQLWYEEKIRFMKIDLDDKTDVLTYHKKLLAEAEKEKEDLKAKDYLHITFQNKGIVDSGCSRHMTGNKAYLAEYQDFNGGPVVFGGSKCYITGKGKIKTGKLDFEDVCFVKELQHFNLFFVSQICDKKNKVLFTDSECLVLSPEFQLPDANQVLLRIPRQSNMYSFNLENIVPFGGLTCLIAKATIDESNKWHRRLGHVNFKNLNKLVKGNLVRGLPSKIFQNDHTCVACQKGKQHKASCKAKSVSSISQPLQLLHMDLFGPTSVRSLNHKNLVPGITNDLQSLLELRQQMLLNLVGQKGSRGNTVMPELHLQNGVAERKNSTLIETC
ncbi:putative ribonuclease H-like domain-containing protein [Tanacetum coccineum]